MKGLRYIIKLTNIEFYAKKVKLIVNGKIKMTNKKKFE